MHTQDCSWSWHWYGTGVVQREARAKGLHASSHVHVPCLIALNVPGAVLGGGFHMVAGPSAIVIGQPGRVRMQYIGAFVHSCSSLTLTPCCHMFTVPQHDKLG